VSEAWEGPWASAAMACDVCAHEWVAVYPTCCHALECPACAYHTRAPVLKDDRHPDVVAILFPAWVGLREALDTALYRARHGWL
jgi:hypothetical protein